LFFEFPTLRPLLCSSLLPLLWRCLLLTLVRFFLLSSLTTVVLHAPARIGWPLPDALLTVRPSSGFRAKAFCVSSRSRFPPSPLEVLIPPMLPTGPNRLPQCSKAPPLVIRTLGAGLPVARMKQRLSKLGRLGLCTRVLFFSSLLFFLEAAGPKRFLQREFVFSNSLQKTFHGKDSIFFSETASQVRVPMSSSPPFRLS